MPGSFSLSPAPQHHRLDDKIQDEIFQLSPIQPTYKSPSITTSFQDNIKHGDVEGDESLLSPIPFTDDSPYIPSFENEELLFLHHLDFLSDPSPTARDEVPPVPASPLQLSISRRPTKTKRRSCQVEGCTRVDRGHGRCGSHGGGRRCRIEYCLKASRKKGLCCKHFRDAMENSLDS